ncbi:MAG TPA: hypothetical protein VND93_34470, partial [Myxococcales bacterium]|nr:hypothetical protein [Myxococcales bacterium]
GLSVRVARIKHGAMKDGPGALSLLAAVLQRRPDHPEAIQVLEEMARSGGPIARAAAEVLEQQYRLSPDDPEALAKLDRTCEQLQKWPELAEVLERRLRLEPARRVDLLLRLAELKRAQLGDPDAAPPLLREVLQARPGHPGAMAQLESVMEERPGLVLAEDLLLAEHRRAGSLPKLIPLLEACSTRAKDPQRRQALWLELADLRAGREGDPQMAFLALARAYREAPADAALRAKLVDMAQAAGAHEELVALLEEVSGRLEPAAAAEVCLVAAGLCEGPVADPDRAVAMYRRAIELAPQRGPQIWPHLDRLLESLGRWEDLLPVLEAEERSAGEGLDRVGLLWRMATIAGERLDLPRRAVEAYRAILQRAPGHLAAARALEALYERLDEKGPLLEILEHLLAHAPADQAPAIRLKLARLRAGTDPARTEALCRQLLAGDPLHAEAFALLAELLEKAGRHEELEQLLLARLGVTLAPEASADLEYRLAELLYRRRGKVQPATARYRAVLQRLPRHRGALVALSEIYESAGARRELAQVLGQLALAHEDPKLQRSAHVRQAEVLAQLGDPQQALAAVRRALDLVPDDEAEIERLRAVLAAQNALPETARILGLAAALRLQAGRTDDAVATWLELAGIEMRRKDPAAAGAALETILVHQPANRRAFDQARALYAGSGDWSALAMLLGRFLPSLEPGERLTTLDQLAELCESKLADAIDAFGWAKQAVLLDPGSAPRRERLERLARTLRRAEELAALYRQILEGPEPGPAFGPLSLSLAAVEDQDLDQVELAERTLGDLLARDRGHAAAIDALVRMFARRGMHRKLAEALELRLESPSGAAVRVQVLQQLAELWETKLEDPAAAADALRRRFDAQRDETSARLLVDFHRRHQQWAEALGALLQMRELVTTPRARALARFEAAELYEKELADPESAVTAHLEALEDDPSAPEPFRALERLYRQLDRPAELLRVYEDRLAHAGRDERIEIFFRSAELWEQRNAPLEAERSLEAALQIRPTEVRAMEELARLRRQGSRWKPLIEILARHLEVADRPEVRAALSTELGEVSLQQMQDSRGAERWWRKAIEYLPTHRPALSALGQLDQKEGRFGHAADLLEREAGLEEDAAARAALLHRAGVIREERLRDLVGARKSYGLAVKADELFWPSVRRLRALFLQARSWPEYEQSLEHEARRSSSEQERCGAAVELAAHFAQRAQGPAKAIDWYRYALEQRPGALEASLPLSDLLLGTQQWAPAAEVLEGAVRVLEERGAESREQLVRRLGQLGLARQQLRRPAPAIEAYGRALELDPGDAAALRGQFQLLDEVGRRDEAAGALQRFLDLHRKSLPAPEQVALGVRLGEMYQSLGRHDEALAAAERALELDAGHPETLRLLVAVCDQLSAFDKSVRYRRQLAGVVGPDERYRLWFDLAEMAHRKLSDPRRAIEGYQEALRVRPGSLEVLQRLPAAYRDAGQEAKAVEALQALLAHPGLPRNDWRRETLALAELLGRQASGLERAVGVLEAAFARDTAFADS